MVKRSDSYSCLTVKRGSYLALALRSAGGLKPSPDIAQLGFSQTFIHFLLMINNIHTKVCFNVQIHYYLKTQEGGNGF